MNKNELKNEPKNDQAEEMELNPEDLKKIQGGAGMRVVPTTQTQSISDGTRANV